MNNSHSDSHSDSILEKPKNQEEKPLLKLSFQATFVFMVFAFLFTLGSRFYIKNPTFKKILFLECIITLVSLSIYGFFNIQLQTTNLFENGIDNKRTITSDQINTIRYAGWSITTPIMLSVLCFVLASNLKTEVTNNLLFQVILLDYVMLFFGFLGEMGWMDLYQAMFIGFIPFFIMFFIIFITFVYKKKSAINMVVYVIYFVLWTGYGLVYIIDPDTKTIVTNLLDALAKGFFAIGLSTQYLFQK